MAYVKKVWVNEVPATTPIKYRVDDDTLGTLATSATIAQVTALTTPGTAVDATNLNHIEQGIADVEDLANAAQAAADAVAITAAAVAGQLTKNVDQSILDATLTTLIWNGSDIDTGGFWSAGSPTRLTLPTTGIYLVGIYATWVTNTVGFRELRLYVNTGEKARYHVVPVTGGDTTVHVSILVSVVAGDYLEAKVWQNSGGALIQAPLNSRFWAHKI